jgi:hypothetical protein
MLNGPRNIFVSNAPMLPQGLFRYRKAPALWYVCLVASLQSNENMLERQSLAGKRRALLFKAATLCKKNLRSF